MSNQEQIDQLNERVKVRIAPSPIHGVGVFAIRFIPKGSRLYADITPQVYDLPYANFGKLLEPVSAIILERWPRVATGERFAYPDTRIQAYMNHSETPNYDAQIDITFCDIQAGEEITENYRKIPGHETVFEWLNNVVK